MSKVQPGNFPSESAELHQPQPERIQTHYYVVFQYLGGSGNAVYTQLQSLLTWLLTWLSISYRAALLDSDTAELRGIPASDAYPLDNVPSYDTVEQMRTAPETLPGSALLGDSQALRDALGPDDDLSRGAPFGERKLGLMSFWYHILRYRPQLSDFLTRAVRDLKAYINTQIMGSNGRKPTRQRHELTINQVYSACGGTGSAIAVYVVDVMRHLLRGDWGLSKISFEADIMLPTVFFGQVETFEVLQAKAYAFFRELSLRYQRRLLPVMLGKLRLPRYRPPYARLFYYDGVNARGEVLTARQHVAQVICVVQQLRYFAGIISDTYRSYSQHMPAEWPYIGASAGAYVLEVPVSEMIQRYGYRTGRLAIDTKWLQSLSQTSDLAHQALKGLLNRQPRLRSLPTFLYAPSGERMQITVSLLVKQFAGVPRQKLSGTLEQFERDQTNVYKTSLNALLETEVPTAYTLIKNWIEPLLNQPSGLALAGQALTELDTHFETLERRHNQQIEHTRTTYSQWEAQWQARRQRWWRRLDFQPRKTRFEYWQRRLQFALDELRQAAQLSYVQQLRVQSTDLKEAVAGWQTALSQLAARLTEAEQAFLRRQMANRSVVIESVLDEHEIENIYVTDRDITAQQAANGLRLSFQEENLILHYRYPQDAEEVLVNDRWRISSPDGVAQHLDYACQFWGHLHNLSVEKILTDQGRSGSEMLEHLLVKSAPLIAADEVLHIPAERHLVVLGSEHGPNGLFGDVEPGPSVNIVTTGDKHRIACLSTVHGINALQLKQTPAWKRAYDEAMAQGRLLHVIPEFDPTAVEALVTEDEDMEPFPLQPTPVSVNGKPKTSPEVEEVDNVSV